MTKYRMMWKRSRSSYKRSVFSAKLVLLAMATASAIIVTSCSSNAKKSSVGRVIPITGHTIRYTTNFPLKENPISEGGRWIDGQTVGLDWGNISTTPGLATGHPGPKRFADATALLKGRWGPTQTAEAVVSSIKPFNYPEVSLRLRSRLSPHKCTGYEISSSLRKGKSAYLIIVRWNGPLADFTYLAQIGGERYGVTTGDVLKATVVGNVITAYKDGIKLAQVTDDTYRTGNPGIGFNEGVNGDYGITRFTVTATDDPVNSRPK